MGCHAKNTISKNKACNKKSPTKVQNEKITEQLSDLWENITLICMQWKSQDQDCGEVKKKMDGKFLLKI